MGHPCGYFLGTSVSKIVVSTVNFLKLKFLWREIYHSLKVRGSHLPEQTALPSLLFQLSKWSIIFWIEDSFIKLCGNLSKKVL